MIINKEKIVCIASGLLLIIGLIFVISNWRSEGDVSIPTIPPVAVSKDLPPIDYSPPKLFSEGFLSSIPREAIVRGNPLQEDTGLRAATPADFPLPPPAPRRLVKIIPVLGAGHDPNLLNRLVIKGAADAETMPDRQSEAVPIQEGEGDR